MLSVSSLRGACSFPDSADQLAERDSFLVKEEEEKSSEELSTLFAVQGIQWESTAKVLWCLPCTAYQLAKCPGAKSGCDDGDDSPLQPLLVRIGSSKNDVLLHCSTREHLLQFEEGNSTQPLDHGLPVEIHGQQMLLVNHCLYPSSCFGPGRVLVDESLAERSILGHDVCGGVKLLPYHRYSVAEIVLPHYASDSIFPPAEIPRGISESATRNANKEETRVGYPGKSRRNQSFYRSDVTMRGKKSRLTTKEMLEITNRNIAKKLSFWPTSDLLFERNKEKKENMKKIYQFCNYLRTGRSLRYLAAGEPYYPFGNDFGLAIIPEYVQASEAMQLRKGYVDIYTRQSASIVLNDGRFQLPPLPSNSFMGLVERVEKDGIVPSGWLNNQTANLYETGDFIRAHVDNLFVYDDIFAIISLGANALARFVHVQTGEELDVVIPDRSLYIMSGPARYVYFHMILPVEAQRFSIVFRRSILNSEGGFRPVNGPLRDFLPHRSTQILHTLYSKQIGGVRVSVDDHFLERDNVGVFDTSKWVKKLHPLRDWSLLKQLEEDAARINELYEAKYLNVDFSWRVEELRRYYTGLEGHLTSK